MAYSPVTITGYNANPPEDDGTHVSTNEISWSGIKAKIGDPLKTAMDAIQIALSASIDPLDTSLKAPTGTVMIFRQTAAPTGWTKITTHDDHALRVVSGTVSTGGTLNFSSAFTARTIAQANLPNVNFTVTGTTSSDGAHSHGIPTRRFYPTTGTNDDTRMSAANGDGTSIGGAGTNSAGTHSHTVTGTAASGGSGTGMDFAVKYVDVIEASKDA